MSTPLRALALPALCLTLLLSGCDLFGGESAESVAARREAEGKAVGSACRHAMRAIEDCYTLNPKAPKASVFAGWREMDEYMRENKLEGVAPTIPTKTAGGAKEAATAETSAKAGPSEGKPLTEGKGKTGKSASKSSKHADAAKADEGAADKTE
jgi:hypothetical protein